MSVRLRRLMSDYEKICSELTGHRYIKLEQVVGNPPERYKLVYKLKSLRWDNTVNRPVELERHEVEIYLPQDYPRNKPQCTINTPIFHPNFSANHTPNMICISDHWAASNRLVDVIVQIGDMLQFRSYNIKSPLNAEAARWALQNESYLPIGNIDPYQPEPEVKFGSELIASQHEDDDLEIIFGQKPGDDDLEIEFK